MSGDRPDWVDDALFPFESRFIDIGSHRVHYIDEGDGPVLLLLHGNPTWSFLYRGAVPLLRHRYRCIALDLPGFGLSTAAPDYLFRPPQHAEVVRRVVEELDLTGITLLVHDWGGPIGLAAAEADPDRYARLVVTNAWAWAQRDLRFVLFSRLVGSPLSRALIRRYNVFVNVFIPVGHRLRRPTDAEMRQWRQPLDTRRRRQASAVLPRAITAEHAFLGRVERGLDAVRHLPSLLLWATGDFAFRDPERRRWQALLTDRTDATLEGAGHYLASDDPDGFARAILAWTP